jgi:hypothetical protein
MLRVRPLQIGLSASCSATPRSGSPSMPGVEPHRLRRQNSLDVPQNQLRLRAGSLRTQARPEAGTAIVRAQAWLADLKNGRFSSVEELAASAKLHPKVMRQALRFAFLSPKITSGILAGNQRVPALRRMPKRLPLDWTSHQSLPSLSVFAISASHPKPDKVAKTACDRFC